MWATLLLGLTGPIVVRVLTTLGLGIVTYTGFAVVLTTVAQAIQASFNGLPLLAMQIVFLSGLPQGMGIILSALGARIALMQLKKIQLL